MNPLNKKKVALAHAIVLALSVTLLSACNSSDGDTAVTDTGTDTTSSWIINTTGEQSKHIYVDGSPAEVNVQYAEVLGNFTVVQATGIPDYSTTITQDLYDKLATRPKAASDFTNGAPNVSVGDVVDFGQNIGFTNTNCGDADHGDGYWPPGPACPEDTSKTGSFPVTPAVSSTACDTGLGPVGYFVNGTSVYNWGDGQSYNGAGVWNNSAAVAEQYDVDICDGHAPPSGDYHHHFHSACLAGLVSDTGNKHSPLYGYAADGYPIHGPWYANGMLAHSSWVARNYDDSTDPYGCGGSGARSCLMVDEYDASQGTTAASSNGPSTSTIITTGSGNKILGTSGYYYEDYYWDSNLTAQGGAYLDQNNGHDHDGLGYHYHLTMSNATGSLVPAFPYTIGPRFHGALQDGAVASCSTGTTSGPPGGGAGGPPPM